MKELEQNTKAKLEISVKQKKQVQHQLIGKIIPHEGHTIWQINNETLEIEKAKFTNATYHIGGENKREIITKQGYTYISALNKKNALKKFEQGNNGSKPINEEPLTL
jgi:hypothetical protein